MSNAATLRRMFELMDQQQTDAVRALLAPGCAAVMGGNPPMDVDTWLGMGQMFYSAFPDGKHTIEEALDIGADRVALRGYFEGTHRAPFLNIPPTGKRIRVTFMNLDRFASGKLAEHRAEVDMMGLIQQLGAVVS